MWLEIEQPFWTARWKIHVEDGGQPDTRSLGSQFQNCHTSSGEPEINYNLVQLDCIGFSLIAKLKPG